MNPRIAVKEAIRFNLINSGMDEELARSVAEQMHDDPTFLESFEDFINEFLDDFGENYGL
jgi:hypothetical protein